MVAALLKTIRTDLYTKFYNLLQTGTYALSTNNIHPHFNRLQLLQERYPQVIVTAPKVALEKVTFGRGANTKYVANFVVMIEAYHSSSANAKTIADEITQKIIIGESALNADNIKGIQVDSDDLDVTDHSAVDSTHMYTITVTGRVLGSVTA